MIYGKGTEFDKSSWYEAWNAPKFKSLFSEPSVKVHGQLRRKFQSTYTMSSMVTYEDFADKCIAILCQRFKEIANRNDKTDLCRWVLSYAADAVSMITYSKRMGFLDSGEDIGDFFKNLHGNILYSSTIGIIPEVHPFIFNTMAWLSKLKITKGTPRMFISRFNANLISEKRSERAAVDEKIVYPDVDENAPRDFLSKFLDFNEQDSSRFTEHDINVGLVGNIIAGADTTAAALTATLYCLLKNPSSLAKLREEVSSASQSGRLSSPPTFKEAHDLPYLNAAIQEAMRLYPPVALPLQRVVPPGGFEICGNHFPAGTVVGVNAAAVHTNKSIFGEDAFVFRPERWLESDKEKLAYMQRHWMPFGLGTRTCIGKNISMLEMTKVIPEVISKFDFELTDGLQEDGKEMAWINRWFMQPTTLPVKITLRNE